MSRVRSQYLPWPAWLKRKKDTRSQEERDEQDKTAGNTYNKEQKQREKDRFQTDYQRKTQPAWQEVEKRRLDTEREIDEVKIYCDQQPEILEQRKKEIEKERETLREEDLLASNLKEYYQRTNPIQDNPEPKRAAYVPEPKPVALTADERYYKISGAEHRKPAMRVATRKTVTRLPTTYLRYRDLATGRFVSMRTLR